jgi:GrpB-like predicted nucleotidyltransferase (UPF0157 family)
MNLKLSYHNPNWSQVFEQERSTIWQCVNGPIGPIEHIGSTAVPGLAARPVVDVAVELAELADLPDLVLLLRSIGYRVDRETEAVSDVAALLVHPRPSRTSTAVWIVPPQSRFLPQAIAHRQLWRENESERGNFAWLKSEWFYASSGSSEAYEESKCQYFSNLQPH